MVTTTTAGDSVFFEAPPTGRRLAGVKNLSVRTLNPLNELGGQRGNA